MLESPIQSPKANVARILVVDDEESIRLTLRAFLQNNGYTVDIAEDANGALAKLVNGSWDVVVTDIVLPGSSGVELLKAIHTLAPEVQVIMMTGEPTVETAAEAVRADACDYLTKPVSKETILLSVGHAVKIKNLRDDRRLMEEEMRAAREAAEAANQAKTDFMSSMNHELRSPLTAILGFSELLQEKFFGPLNPKQEGYVNDIVESGRHLLALINDVLDLAKVEAGKMELSLSTVPVAPLLEHSLMMIKEKCLAHGIRLSLDVPEELLPFTIRADERQMKQVLFNLLSNAGKFTPDGGSITLSARLLLVPDPSPDPSDPNPKQPVLLISVTDTGIGIPPEFHSHIFHEFMQIRNDMTGKTPGTGLGLSLVKRFVELHGGRVWVESEGEGKGSAFRFTLPQTGVQA
jgi:signal transduction histidine kinase